jgi:hypothetical protein
VTRIMESLVAGIGIFVGSLLWDTLFGDGIQDDDYVEALSIALLAALIQYGLCRLQRQRGL